MTRSLFPLSSFESITQEEANRCLVDWGHKMGALHRGKQIAKCHGLFVDGEIVAVTTTSTLIREVVGGVFPMDLNRENTIELSRLCASKPWVCRVALRLWRECVFPGLGKRFAISYQDADLHTGNTYRFDGWRKVGFSRSGVDQRSGRKGRNKFVWLWALPPANDREEGPI